MFFDRQMIPQVSSVVNGGGDAQPNGTENNKLKEDEEFVHPTPGNGGVILPSNCQLAPLRCTNGKEGMFDSRIITLSSPRAEFTILFSPSTKSQPIPKALNHS